uniref:Uncharacterized protein n=1 Tax=Anguilla anguilla TaxID=7936 RepID=A0A0E9P7H3_ANGAN
MPRVHARMHCVTRAMKLKGELKQDIEMK